MKEHCFHETKIFSGIGKKLHFGVKIFFFFFFFFFWFFFFFFFFFFFCEIPVFLGFFWSGVVGAIDTFVAEHVANMLS